MNQIKMPLKIIEPIDGREYEIFGKIFRDYNFYIKNKVDDKIEVENVNIIDEGRNIRSPLTFWFGEDDISRKKLIEVAIKQRARKNIEDGWEKIVIFDNCKRCNNQTAIIETIITNIDSKLWKTFQSNCQKTKKNIVAALQEKIQQENKKDKKWSEFKNNKKHTLFIFDNFEKIHKEEQHEILNIFKLAQNIQNICIIIGVNESKDQIEMLSTPTPSSLLTAVNETKSELIEKNILERYVNLPYYTLDWYETKRAKLVKWLIKKNVNYIFGKQGRNFFYNWFQAIYSQETEPFQTIEDFIVFCENQELIEDWEFILGRTIKAIVKKINDDYESKTKMENIITFKMKKNWLLVIENYEQKSEIDRMIIKNTLSEFSADWEIESYWGKSVDEIQKIMKAKIEKKIRPVIVINKANKEVK